MSSSNCCFLTCIQISQEAGQVVWYSHLLQNFPQFIVIHTVKGFGIVNKAEIDVFLELSWLKCIFIMLYFAIWRLNICLKDIYFPRLYLSMNLIQNNSSLNYSVKIKLLYTLNSLLVIFVINVKSWKYPPTYMRRYYKGWSWSRTSRRTKLPLPLMMMLQ